MWKTPGNPDKIEVLSPIPVDNCVENVDFRIGHAVNIHRRICSLHGGVTNYDLWGYG